MKILSFIPLLFVLVLNSCATMSAEEKSQWLAKYKEVSTERSQRTFSGPYGARAKMRAEAFAGVSDAAEKRVIEEIMFKENTGHGVDTLMQLIVDADVRAINETYSGKEIRHMVKFYNSEDGKRYSLTADKLRKEMAAKLAANPTKDPEPTANLYKAKFKDLEKSIAHHFGSKTGLAIKRKRDLYLAKKYRYEHEASLLYNEKIKAAMRSYAENLPN